MFQVDVEKVMYATGVQKPQHYWPGLDVRLAYREKISAERHLRAWKNIDSTASESKDKGETTAKSATEEVAEGEATEGDAVESKTALPELSEEAHQRWQYGELRGFLRRCKALLKSEAKTLSAKEKMNLRMLRADAKRLLSHPKDSELDISEMMDELQLAIKNHEVLTKSSPEAGAKTGETAEKQEFSREKQYKQTLDGLSEEQKDQVKEIVKDHRLSNDEMRKLRALMLADAQNPVDETKPYATPWAPRPFMAAFAYIPRYLEVNHNICAAVYLRHPVARKGHAEVPTPFGYLTNQLAHNWYLQRG